MGHSLESAGLKIERLRAELEVAVRDPTGFQVCVGGAVHERQDLDDWAETGVTRLIVSPWTRSRDAVAGLERLASVAELSPGR
jgi:hypothetical protein